MKKTDKCDILIRCSKYNNLSAFLRTNHFFIRGNMKNFWSSVAMISATIIWGAAFSAQSSAMQYVKPVLFIALRSAVGVTALAAVIALSDILRNRKISLWGNAVTPGERNELLTGGLWCGICITLASILQQCGVQYTSAGKTGFLTALYIIIVPVLGIFIKRKTGFSLWIAVIFALCGSHLLCGGITDIDRGEWLVIACAFAYSLHILVIDRYAGKCDCMRLSFIQFTVAIISLIISLVFERELFLSGILSSMPFWLFCGIGSSALAFTLQIAAQKHLHPVTASLLMSLESVFAVIGGWIFLHETLSLRELSGCAMIFAAIIIPQIPFNQKNS